MQGKNNFKLISLIILAALSICSLGYLYIAGGNMQKVYAAESKKFYTVSYGSIFSGHGYEDEDGVVSYCANQNLKGPGSDGTKYHQVSTKHSYDYLMYHGYPNTNVINGVKWTNNQARDITQYAAWLLELGQSFNRDDQSANWNKAADVLFKGAEKYKGGGIEDGSSTLWSSDDPEKQKIIQWNPSGFAKLKKISAQSQFTDENPCYSLKDAKYGIYSEKDCINLVGTLITDESGNSNTIPVLKGEILDKRNQGIQRL